MGVACCLHFNVLVCRMTSEQDSSTGRRWALLLFGHVSPALLSELNSIGSPLERTASLSELSDPELRLARRCAVRSGNYNLPGARARWHRRYDLSRADDPEGCVDTPECDLGGSCETAAVDLNLCARCSRLRTEARDHRHDVDRAYCLDLRAGHISHRDIAVYCVLRYLRCENSVRTRPERCGFPGKSYAVGL